MKKETKIALTAIVALVLLFIGLNFLKGINVFQSTNTFYVKFKDVAGLAISNPVYANGYPVGIVRTIEYDYDKGEKVIVGMELDDEMKVPAGTRAELEAELMGGVKMSLILGPNPANNLAAGDTISGGMHKGMMDKVQTMIPALEVMLPKLDSIMTNLNRLTSDPALAQTLQNTAAMTQELKETSAELNRMMKADIPQTMRNLKTTSENTAKLTGQLAKIDVDKMVQSVNATLDNANQLSNNLNTTVNGLNHKLNSREGTLGLLLNDRSLYDNLNGTLGSADSLLIDLKAHPKRYVHFSIFGRKDK